MRGHVGEVMRTEGCTNSPHTLDAVIEPILRAARIPGAAIAIVSAGKMEFAKGYGYRDLEKELPATVDTVYPIASTTKALNATLIGMLVDEGKLAWDVPVQNYMPSFRLQDRIGSLHITLRDLLVMRTGLPRHDWTWMDHTISRPDLVNRLRHLELSAGFRERFQYNNLTAMSAGHLAEVITGQCWEYMIQQRLLNPLNMKCTGFSLPSTGAATKSYHENCHRELEVSRRFATEVAGPSGGSIHSTVEDMARWILFNLNGGKVAGRALIEAETLKEVHSGYLAARSDSACPTPNAAYAMGWFVDTYNGCHRLTHGGLLHDVSSEVTLFPEQGIGIVSFINLPIPKIARLINQRAFDWLMRLEPQQSLDRILTEYEEGIDLTRTRNAAMHQVLNTSPSHRLTEYVGRYVHPGYGTVEIDNVGSQLSYRQNSLVLPMVHWHYDAWVAQDIGIFPRHCPHAFDRTNQLVFETNTAGEVSAICVRLEPSVAPIRFEKMR